MALFKKEDKVKIKYTTLEGVVEGAEIDQETFEVMYFVRYTDHFGLEQTRYCDESQLEAI
jgi:hypothetical protein